MKIIVDELPETPRDCPFSLLDLRCNMYVCQLRPFREEAGGKPRCVCKSVVNCDQLVELPIEINDLRNKGILD